MRRAGRRAGLACIAAVPRRSIFQPAAADAFVAEAAACGERPEDAAGGLVAHLTAVILAVGVVREFVAVWYLTPLAAEEVAVAKCHVLADHALPGRRRWRQWRRRGERRRWWACAVFRSTLRARKVWTFSQRTARRPREREPVVMAHGSRCLESVAVALHRLVSPVRTALATGHRGTGQAEAEEQLGEDHHTTAVLSKGRLPKLGCARWPTACARWPRPVRAAAP